MKRLCSILGLMTCLSLLMWSGCAEPEQPAAEITGVGATGTGTGTATTPEEYAKQSGGMQPGAYQGQSGYPGAKGR
jgi:hypothetical protein